MIFFGIIISEDHGQETEPVQGRLQPAGEHSMGSVSEGWRARGLPGLV